MRQVYSIVTVLLTVACNAGHVQEADATESPAVSEVSAIPDAATERSILAARDAIWRAWFANDTAQLRQLLPEALAAGAGSDSTQQWSDRAQSTRQAQQFAAAGGTLVRLEFPKTDIRLAGDVAVVFSTFEFETAMHGAHHVSRGQSAEIFVRRNGRWVNPFWHLSA